MPYETIITCDGCGERTGESGSGSMREYVDCQKKTPNGFVYAVLKGQTRWIYCHKCWIKMQRLLWEAKEEEEKP